MRLIDADEMGKKLDELYAEVEGIDFGGVEGYHLFQDGIIDAQYWLDEMPTIDAVEVIRCKDCIYHWENLIGDWSCCWDDDNRTWTHADGFCDKARSEEE